MTNEELVNKYLKEFQKDFQLNTKDAIFLFLVLTVAIPNIYEFLRVSFRRVYYRKEIAEQKAREAYYKAHPEERPVCHVLLTTEQWEKMKAQAEETLEHINSRDKSYDLKGTGEWKDSSGKSVKLS